jgi:cytochrome c oxidase assembly protein subunit 15
LLLISWDEPSPGFLIEHSHRLAGYIVGCCVIVLAVGLYCSAPRWLGWLGLAALLGVIVQGLLGGFRVYLHALMGNKLAFIHGCFAQVVFALLVSLALFTSHAWASGTLLTPREAARVRYWSLLTVAVVFLQIVLGAWVRHTGSALGQRGHLLLAFGVVAAVACLTRTIFDCEVRDRHLTRPALVLIALVVVQLILGVETWLLRSSPAGMFDLHPVTKPQAVIRTAHVLVGSLTLAAVVVVSLQAHRPAAVVDPALKHSVHGLEGAA